MRSFMSAAALSAFSPVQGSSLRRPGFVDRYLAILYQLLHLAEVAVVCRLVQLRIRRHGRLPRRVAATRPNSLTLGRRWNPDKDRQSPPKRANDTTRLRRRCDARRAAFGGLQMRWSWIVPEKLTKHAFPLSSPKVTEASAAFRLSSPTLPTPR